MARRSFEKAIPGQIYAIEWPEWHVDCGKPGCDTSTLVVGLGEALTLKEAEKAIKNASNSWLEGWRRVGDLWFCPAHSNWD
jgi:hypothetical protein